ncbi:uncharacterized protein LOC125071472 [Vanessa atalanta]|uniref:uncharacterized protein LOC125071472 n=1 Tax=Vanessa atalanta TaxID=42275 RepID=UPI001FCD9FE7|nr:uncharacterized protein LOC125071472 [Vanessa atalanta]
MEDWESDTIVEQWIRENDDTFMSIPAIESSPHLLISKVRKHYMEYLIKLLSVNYENNQKLQNKNIYLPSAIWRCAKMIEMSAAQASMVVQLYRKSITNVVKDLKKNTNDGLLYKMLNDFLHQAPENEKKTQVTLGMTKDCNCKCSCNQRNIKKILDSPKNVYGIKSKYIPFKNQINKMSISVDQNFMPTPDNLISKIKTETLIDMKSDTSLPEISEKIKMEMQNSDELMQQLEKLFQEDPNDDDLFDGALCEANHSKAIEKNKLISHTENIPEVDKSIQNISISQELESKETKKKGLDERLELLSGVLVNNMHYPTQDPGSNQNRKSRTSKWLCEEYFQKVKLFELLDQIRDCDRNKLMRIKEMLIELFGEDSDDEGVVSPLEESTEFIVSCKERIAPWVVQILTPYYVKGRIRGKTLFKSLAKHLIRLIYQCSKYPYEYEVQSFVNDFLNSHKMIRCEADFKQFKIENV